MAAKKHIFGNFTFKFEGLSEETKKTYVRILQDLGSNECGTKRYTLMTEEYFLENINKPSDFYDIKYIQECITNREALDIDLFKLKPKILRRPPCYIDKYVTRVDFTRGFKFVMENFKEVNSKISHLCYNPIPMALEPSIKAENISDLKNTDKSSLPSLSPVSTASSAGTFFTSKSTLSSQSDSQSLVNSQDTCQTIIQNDYETVCNSANIKMEVCNEVHNNCSILKTDGDISAKNATQNGKESHKICSVNNLKHKLNSSHISEADPCQCEEEQQRIVDSFCTALEKQPCFEQKLSKSKEIINKDTLNLQSNESQPAQSLSLPESMDTDASFHYTPSENLVYVGDTEQSMCNKRDKIRRDNEDSPFHYTPSQNLIYNPDDSEKSNNEKGDRRNKENPKNVRDLQIINSLGATITEETFQEITSATHNKGRVIDLTDTFEEVIQTNQVHDRKLNASQKVSEGASTSSVNTNRQGQNNLQKRSIIQNKSQTHNKGFVIDLTDQLEEVLQTNQVHDRKLCASQKVNEGASTSSYSSNPQRQINLQKRNIIHSNIEKDESDEHLTNVTLNDTKLNKSNKRAKSPLKNPTLSKKLKTLHNSHDNENKGNSESADNENEGSSQSEENLQISQNAKHSNTRAKLYPYEYDITGTWLDVCVLGEKKCKYKNCPLSPEPHERHGVPESHTISLLEKKILLRYLTSRRLINRGRGLEVWQQMFHEGYLNNRKIEGLRNHFKRSILEEFRTYNIPEEVKAMLSEMKEKQTSKRAVNNKLSRKPANGKFYLQI